MASTPSLARNSMWPWASFAGKQAVSLGMLPCPSRYSFRLDMGLWTTWKPSFVKNVCQKGYSSQKFRQRGRPIRPRRFSPGL